MDLEPKTSSDSESESAVYEMLWDCEYCGTRKLLGLTHRFCPNCGAGQNPQKRCFPADNEKIAVKDHPYVGADRVCPACRNPSSAKSEFCGQCGSPMDEAKAAAIQADQIRLAGQKDFTDANSPTLKPKTGSTKHWAIAAAVVLVVGLVLAGIFWTKTVPLRLDHHGWERMIKIESFLPRQVSAWCDTMPADAYAVSHRQEVRSHRQVADGQVCNTRRVDRGDGTYEEKQECSPKYRDEPVYDQYCSFTVNRWGYARAIVTSDTNQNPYWGEVRLNGAGGQCFGCERETSRQEALTLYFKSEESKPKTYHCEVAASVWNQAKPNSAWSIKQGKLLGEGRCNSLRPAD